MQLIDKHGFLQGLSLRRPVILELGCGNRKRTPGAIGIDVIDYDCVDIVGDAVDVLRNIPDGVVDSIASHHFLEHVGDLGSLVGEATRTLRIGGRFEAVVPHFSNPYFYSDPTHSRHFGLYTFSYLAHDDLLRRKVPKYNETVSLRLLDVDLLFKSAPPFYVRAAFKMAFGKLFNSCRSMQEFYEEFLCYGFPCYEIRYLLEKIPAAATR